MIQGSRYQSTAVLKEMRDLVRADDPLMASHLLDSPEPPDAAAQAGFSDLFMAAARIDEPVAVCCRLALEFIFEGHLLHWSRSRIIDPGSTEFALLAGDYMYARGLESLASVVSPACVSLMGDLISVCAFLQCPPGRRSAESAGFDSPNDIAKLAAAYWSLATLALALEANPASRVSSPGEIAALSTRISSGALRGDTEVIAELDALLGRFPQGAQSGLRSLIDEIYCAQWL